MIVRIVVLIVIIIMYVVIISLFLSLPSSLSLPELPPSFFRFLILSRGWLNDVFGKITKNNIHNNKGNKKKMKIRTCFTLFTYTLYLLVHPLQIHCMSIFTHPNKCLSPMSCFYFIYIYLFISISFYESIYLSVCRSLSISLSICLSINIRRWRDT